MGAKVENTFYSDKEIRTVLERKGYVFPYLQSPLCTPKYKEHLIAEPDFKFEDMYKLFKSIVNKRLNQSKQQFLDSL
jgi:hypothetical protein